MLANQPFKIVITKNPSLNKLSQNTKALGLEILFTVNGYPLGAPNRSLFQELLESISVSASTFHPLAF